MTVMRNGPRPLPLHLAAAATISTSSASAWPMLRNGWTPWSDDLAEPGNALQRNLASVNPEAFSAVLIDELAARNDKFLTGIEMYRSHPYKRTLTPPPPLWESGPVQLQDFGATHPDGENGKPVLVIPSLVNRGYIMDLTVNRSFLRFLASKGLRPLLVDWGTPGKAELAQTLDDCVSRTLRDALAVAVETNSGGPVPLIGYCMGGTLATALAVLEPEDCEALVLLASPWDFHAGTNGPPAAVTMGRTVLERIISASGCLPVDTLQSMFFSLDPMLGWNKFRAFADLDSGSAKAELFVALEDWLNDGVPLAADIARSCLFDWYGKNSPANGAWRVAGTLIDPARLDLPTLGVVPTSDRIVPPASAAALVDRIANAQTLTPAAGHIGMMVGGQARARLWKPLTAWLSAV